MTYNDSNLIFSIPRKQSHFTKHHSNYVDNFYVYSWDDNGKPFYIGMGSKRRAWNTHCRDLESIKLMSRCFEITIIEDSLTRREALDLEKELIKQYNESCHNPIYSRITSNTPLTDKQRDKWLSTIASYANKFFPQEIVE